MSSPPSTPDRPTASQPTSRSAATSSLLTTPRRTAAATSSAAGIGDPQPALEAGLDAQPLEPLGHPLAAAVDEDDRPLAGDRRDLGQDLLLVGERRPAELDDDDLAHVVYSEFSRTYSSVRSQPKASPVPSPRPEVEADQDLLAGHRLAGRAPCRSAAGRRRGRRRRGGRRSRSGASTGRRRARLAVRGPASPAGSPAASSIGRLGDDARCPRRRRSRPQFGSRPWTAALTSELEITARATARASASSAAPVTWQVMQRRRALAVARPAGGRGPGPTASIAAARAARARRRRSSASAAPAAPGGEQEHGVVGAGVAVDRELVPRARPRRRAAAHGASPGRRSRR